MRGFGDAPRSSWARRRGAGSWPLPDVPRGTVVVSCARGLRRQERPRRGIGARTTAVGLLLACLGFALSASAEPYSETLIRKAHALHLDARTQWLRLGHWRANLFGGSTSEVDGAAFFLSPNGKDDPSAELDETLRSFFQPAPTEEATQHPQCRFPARFAWLDQELGFDRARLETRRCPRFEEFLGFVEPGGLTLVFSSYYLNNPASAFGHTFLRVRKRGVRRQGDGQSLLDYGVDFAAVVDTANPMLYAVKGLTGQFPGTFSKLPYYVKVRTYNDHESRDLWEYDLALTPEEVQRVVAHLWELGTTYFAYYYVSENCSYHILGLLEAASPRIRLLKHLGWPVIPADTVKALASSPGLIEAVHFRPSNATQFKRRVDGLTSDELAAVASLMVAPRAALPPGWAPAKQAHVLDVALDLADFRYARDLVLEPAERDPDDAALQQGLLARRAALRVVSEPDSFAPPFREQPTAGHDSTRLGLGEGFAAERGWFQSLSFRLALHDLSDPSDGFPDGAAIEFLPMAFRHFVESSRAELSEFSLVRISSLTPLSRFVKQLSWQVDVGAHREYDRGCNGCLMGHGLLGGGAALAAFSGALTVYGMAEARLAVPTEAGLLGWVRAGGGPSGGIRLRLLPELIAHARGRWTYLPEQQPWHTWELNGELRWGYTKNAALGVEGSRAPEEQSLRAVSYLYF